MFGRAINMLLTVTYIATDIELVVQFIVQRNEGIYGYYEKNEKIDAWYRQQYGTY